MQPLSPAKYWHAIFGKGDTQMKNKKENDNIIYRPVLFTVGTFLITWCCAALMAKIEYHTHTVLFTFLDFLENASPLLSAIVLLRRYMTGEKFSVLFFFGAPNKISRYAIVFALFAAQFLNFYLFKAGNVSCSAKAFMVTFAGQFLLGGGLEEGGWRGYLLPCLYKKYNILFSSVAVSMIWVLWHLPYFFIQDSMQAGGNFLSYAIIGIITGFVLTAIWLLTKSVILCMLFHSWQNTIVMTVPADMSNPWFMVTFVFLGMIAVFFCLVRQKQDRLKNPA